MWGHSMGGYLMLRAMVVSPEIKAGVIWAGVVGSYSDMLTGWRRNRPTATPGGVRMPSWRIDWIEAFGSPEVNPEFWNAISSNTYVADITAPVQLHHGTADESVPTRFSQILYDQMQAAGKEAELYLYEGDDHNLSNYFSTAMQRTIEFYDRYLKP
jgi:dipeptidyl aminopeptidase/acylaminoacyl peptidase